MAAIRLGDRCTVSQSAHRCGGSHDVDSDDCQLVADPIDLEAHVWICAEALVAMRGRIAEGAVVGARVVVTRDLTAPWTVYAGVPARPIRPRRRRTR